MKMASYRVYIFMIQSEAFVTSSRIQRGLFEGVCMI